MSAAALGSPGSIYERLLWRNQTLRIDISAAIYDPKETPKLVLLSKQRDDIHWRYKNLFLDCHRLEQDSDR
jgi:hypothetical protein